MVTWILSDGLYVLSWLLGGVVVVVAEGIIFWILASCRPKCEHRQRLFSTAPAYHDGEQLVGVLQQVQALIQLLSAQPSADPGLDDVVALLMSIQLDFGWNTSLETVIQTLVAQHMLAREVRRRRTRKRMEMAEVSPVPAIAQEVG